MFFFTVFDSDEMRINELEQWCGAVPLISKISTASSFCFSHAYTVIPLNVASLVCRGKNACVDKQSDQSFKTGIVSLFFLLIEITIFFICLLSLKRTHDFNRGLTLKSQGTLLLSLPMFVNKYWRLTEKPEKNGIRNKQKLRNFVNKMKCVISLCLLWIYVLFCFPHEVIMYFRIFCHLTPLINQFL